MTESKQGVDPIQTHSPSVPEFTTCDEEKIHIPGSIQPHGLLMTIQEPSLTIIQVSSNVSDLLSLRPQELLLSPLSSLLTPESMEHFKPCTIGSTPSSAINPRAITTLVKNCYTRWDGIVHRTQDLLILELEPSTEPREGSMSLSIQQARLSLSRLDSTESLQSLFEDAAEEIRLITGFDRVMIYRFHENSHGEVIAEKRQENLESFLGLHYPASDIPKQARMLYEKNWLRLIPDVSYRPAPLIPLHNPLLDSPLDLTFASLRSVSPVHCEYLQNMNVKASLSISLLKDGKLWGLIACHHYQGSKYVPYGVRATCEFLGQLLSWQISSKQQSEENENRVLAKTVEMKLIELMSLESDFVQALLKNKELLLDLVGASGSAIHYDGQTYLVGITPLLSEVQKIIDWLNTQDLTSLWHTNSLSESFAQTESMQQLASGLLMVSLSKARRDYLIWFRPEAARTVRWAGNPNQAVIQDEKVQNRIGPRKSFALWQEAVDRKSFPWLPRQIEAAQSFRGAILGIIVKKAAEIKKLKTDLAQVAQARDDFMSVASHELNTPLTTLQLQLQSLLHTVKRTEGDLPQKVVIPKLELAQRQVKRLGELIENLMDVSRISTGRLKLNPEHHANLSDLLNSIIQEHRPNFEKAKRELRSHIQPNVTGSWDTLRLSQIFTNLITNAFKYGGSGAVDLFLEAESDRIKIRVKDQGIGILPERIDRIFDRFERAVPEHSYKGLGLGLWIVRQILEEMGGQISVISQIGKGSEFRVELPKNPK